jgi:predicted DNA repair protein MutK
MSGLLTLLDDVAAIAKVASASLDDIASQAAKAGAKAAGAVIDDAAVTPKYVHGFQAARELPIVWKIARASVFNKLVILLPIAMLLSQFAPWLIPYFLLLGGLYLCFEGAEKVYHWLVPHDDLSIIDPETTTLDDTHLEEQRVKGAIKTDFILSAEIMTIILANIDPGSSWYFEAAVLGLAALIITLAVYGAVALIVKADDVGLAMAEKGRLSATRSVGRAVVKGMPTFMQALTIVGTAAMIWVGGNIVVHAVGEIIWHGPFDFIHAVAVAAAGAVPAAAGFVEWLVTAVLDGIVGVAIGMLLIPVVGMFGKKDAAH